MVFLEISGLSNNCGVTAEAGFWDGTNERSVGEVESWKLGKR